jgi:hypothetical protein
MRITFSQREVEFLKDLDQMLINFWMLMTNTNQF